MLAKALAYFLAISTLAGGAGVIASPQVRQALSNPYVAPIGKNYSLGWVNNKETKLEKTGIWFYCRPTDATYQCGKRKGVAEWIHLTDKTAKEVRVSVSGINQAQAWRGYNNGKFWGPLITELNGNEVLVRLTGGYNADFLLWINSTSSEPMGILAEVVEPEPTVTSSPQATLSATSEATINPQ